MNKWIYLPYGQGLMNSEKMNYNYNFGSLIGLVDKVK